MGTPYTSDKNVNSNDHFWKAVWHYILKAKTRMSGDSTIPLQCSVINRSVSCMYMFMEHISVPISIISNNQMPTTEEWINQSIFVQRTSTPAMKMNKLQPQATTWMNFKHSTLNKKNETQKIHCILLDLHQVLRAQRIHDVLSQNNGYLWRE